MTFPLILSCLGNTIRVSIATVMCLTIFLFLILILLAEAATERKGHKDGYTKYGE